MSGKKMARQWFGLLETKAFEEGERERERERGRRGEKTRHFSRCFSHEKKGLKNGRLEKRSLSAVLSDLTIK